MYIKAIQRGFLHPRYRNLSGCSQDMNLASGYGIQLTQTPAYGSPSGPVCKTVCSVAVSLLHKGEMDIPIIHFGKKPGRDLQDFIKMDPTSCVSAELTFSSPNCTVSKRPSYQMTYSGTDPQSAVYICVQIDLLEDEKCGLWPKTIKNLEHELRPGTFWKWDTFFFRN